MRIRNVLLIARHTWKHVFLSRTIYPILLLFFLLTGFACYNAYKTYRLQEGIRKEYQQMARDSWERNPDKHPHRMAHFGSFAFRVKHPLSMFDFGIGNFTGNAVFLEAHRQNTVNFSEAGLSTGLLRFGEVNLAMLLQVIFPLILFFIGFACVASEKENGTLKVLLTQGCGWKELITGKAAGLMAVAMLFLLPVLLVTLALLIVAGDIKVQGNTWPRFILVCTSYILFTWILCVITVIISAISKTAKASLLSLLGIWMFFVILLPKTTQAIGTYLHPSPSKLAFEEAVEKDVIREGDSHNPDDPHYKGIKDSLLKVYKVDSVQQLPFNYSGFIGREGERLSAEIYNRHLASLVATYQRQNGISTITSIVSPFAAQKQLSMTLAGTDYASYLSFQEQAEAYRYQLAQKMNELQMELISNRRLAENDKPYSISRSHWKAFPDFRYEFLSTRLVVKNGLLSILSLIVWVALSFLLIHFVSQKAKAI